MKTTPDPCQVTSYAVSILSVDGDLVTLSVDCSAGFYIRSLAHDLGERLGIGAHLTALRRIASGPLHVDGAISIDALQALEPAQREARLLPPDVLLGAWPAVRLEADDAGRFLSGLRRRLDAPDCPAVRVYGPEPRAFLGSGHVKAGELIPTRLLSPPEVAALLAPHAPSAATTPAYEPSVSPA